MKYIERYKGFIVGLILFNLFFVQCLTALQEVQTIDESVYISSGYLHLVTNDFNFNVEHPPLIKEFIAAPLVLFFRSANEAFRHYEFNGYFKMTTDFLYKNAVSADVLLFFSRLPIILLSGLLGFFIYRWSRQLFGTIGGLLSLLVYALSPDIIAHGHYATLDIGVTLFFYLTIYYLYKFLKQQQSRFLILTGIFFGCALASKFSAAALILIIPIVLGIFHWQGESTSFKRFCQKTFKPFLIIILLGFMVIWSTYRFELKKPIDSGEFQKVYQIQEQMDAGQAPAKVSPIMSTVVSITDIHTFHGKLIRKLVERVPIPAYSYISGFLWQFRHNDAGQNSYFLGQYSSTGWWNYFLVAFLVKEPVSVLILLTILLVTQLYRLLTKQYSPFRSILKRAPSYFYFLVIPVLCYGAFSVLSQLNLGIRYIMPVFPFIFVGLGYIATIRFKKYRIAYGALIALVLIFNIYSTVRAYPNYLSYFNEIIGGPANGHKYLLDSNIDWGQDLKKLKHYLDEHHVDQVCLFYFGIAKPAYYGLKTMPWPRAETADDFRNKNCVAAVSVQYLYSKDFTWHWLLQYAPAAKIGYSIYVYDFRVNAAGMP